MVENALLQQRLPHAHRLHAGVDAGALLHLPVHQLGAHAALPVTVHKSIKVCSLQLIVCFMLLRTPPRPPPELSSTVCYIPICTELEGTIFCNCAIKPAVEKKQTKELAGEKHFWLKLILSETHFGDNDAISEGEMKI